MMAEDTISGPEKYYETELFRQISKEIDDSQKNRRMTKRLCLVGAKGVGKSSLLKALSAKYTNKDKPVVFDILFEEGLTSLQERITSLVKVTGGEEETDNLLFVDNIQCLPPALKGIVKVNIQRLDVLVCASSRAGLLNLIGDKTIRLNPYDLEIRVVNPEEKVTIKIFKDFYHKEITDTVSGYLERIGHVPQDAITLAQFLSVDPEDIATIFARFENAALGLLMSDKESSNSAAYLKFLTICAAGEIKELRMLDSLQLSLANLPWSMLMMEKRDKVNVIKPVSPLCKKVMQEYIASTPDTWKTVYDLMDSVAMSADDSRGVVFERVVHQALTKADKFTYYNCVETATEVQLGIIATNVSRASSLSSVGSIAKSENTCLYTPFMTGCDIVLNVGQQQYFIQCTIGKLEKKARFWEHAPPGAISLLVTPYCNLDYIRAVLDRKSEVATMFQQDKFKLVDASFIPSSEIKYFR